MHNTKSNVLGAKSATHPEVLAGEHNHQMTKTPCYADPTTTQNGA
jgi:hypothetical protein